MSLNRNDEVRRVADKAKTYLEFDQFKKAEILLNKSIERLGYPATLLNLRGALFHKQSRFLEAIEEFRRAKESEPNHIEASLNLAATLADTSQYTQANKIMADLLKSKPGSSNFDAVAETLADHHARCGQIYENLGDLNSACLEYERASSLTKNIPAIRLNLAKLYIKQKNLEAARLELDQIIKKFPQYSDAYITLGLLYLKFNKPNMAKKYWQKAAQTAPQSAKARIFVNLSSLWPSDEGISPSPAPLP